MADYNTYRTAQGVGTRSAVIDQGLRAYMNRVYGLMSVGMLVTAILAWGTNMLAVAPDGQLTSLGVTIYQTPLKWVIMFAPLLVVFGFGAALNRLSVQAATMVFYGFAALMGVSISWIFIAYTSFSIVQTFLVTAISFAGLSLWGYTTKKDISGWGSFLIMGVIGLLIAMVVNMFLQNPMMYFVINAIGVLIFSGLIAYDTQRLKMTYYALGGDQQAMGVATGFGALSLFINFVNLFQFLLAFMGGRE